MRLFICLLSLLSLAGHSAHAETYELWLDGFKKQALAKGISPQTFDMAFRDVSPNQRVIDLDRKQPERKKIGFEKYLHNVMSQKRIDQGRAHFAQNRPLLMQTERNYGVPAQVIVSLWGIETSYGANTGGFDLIESLATLSWEGRRQAFFEKELLTALEILQGGHVERRDFKGSWAGAMGQNQFMPTSWQRFAVDASGDGHKDIWNTKADIFASSANYLKQNGWNSGYPWGWQVTFPVGAKIAGGPKPLSDWIKTGIRFKNGHIPNGQTATIARLIVPDGGNNRAYLVTSNYDTILTWNRSDYFALTVGLLSDLIAMQPEQPSGSFNQ